MAASRKLLPSKRVVEAVAEVLARHVAPRARLTLALSGGLDSTVLLDVLAALRERHAFLLQAVHVHHGLSPHADDWADFCVRLCAAHDVDLRVAHAIVPRDDQAGIEAAARRERQRIFAAQEADFLLTAHQQDDQAETLLLQLLRGAGPKGLAAMPEVQRRPGWRAALLRPLLGAGRAALRDYAAARALRWVEDESNAEVRYRRNALRCEVMPALARHFPGCAATLARAATLQAEAAALLDDLAQLDARTAIADDRLDCEALSRLTPQRARNLLRHFVGRSGLPLPNARVLEEALRQLLGARHDARVRINLNPWELWRFRGGAYLVPPAPPLVGPVRWQGEATLWVPACGVQVQFESVVGKGLKLGLLAGREVMLGARQGGERLQLQAGGPHHSLKKLLQEHAVPPWQRARLPLLWCDGHLAWVAGIGFDAALCAGPGEAGVSPRMVEARAGQDSTGLGMLS